MGCSNACDLNDLYELVLENAGPKTLHQLRIRLKQLRYSIEFFAEILGEEGKPVIDESKIVEPAKEEVVLSGDESDVVKRIQEILENYVKPAVEMDGGAIQFKSFKDGKVNLALQGSCSGCPSSMITLKAGIEGMMKRMIPEVEEVVAEAE